MYHEMGSIYRIKGDYDQALENIEYSLQISEKMNLIPQMVLSLVMLVLIYLDKNDREQANRYFLELESHIDKTDYKVITQGFFMTKALMIKSKGRFQNRAEAEKLFKEVVEDDIIDPVFQILSVVLLCDLLMEELSFSNDPEILEEIDPLIGRLLNIAEIQNSSLYLAETKLLQAKLALIQMNIEKAQYLMTQAQREAELHDLDLLAVKISVEHDSLLERLEEWSSLKEINAPLSERINLASIDEVIDRLQGKKAIEPLKLSPETPVFILIFKENEIPLFSHSFSQQISFEDDIISSFISAFNTFSRELFSKGLDRAKFGDYLILVESVDPFSVCYIFKGQTYPAKQKLADFVKEIQNNSMILETLEKLDKTSQVAELKDLPQIETLIKDTFLS